MNQQERSSYVKAQMTSALLELLRVQPIEEVSVRELTNRPGVGRVSFYRHFESKEDILRQESDCLIKEWGAAFEQSPGAGLDTLFPNLFNFLLKMLNCMILGTSPDCWNI